MKILVIDDEEKDYRKLEEAVRQYASERGMEVSLSYYPSIASFPFSTLSDYDLLFLDIDLKSEKNGMDFAKEIRKANSNILIIFVTNMAQFALEGYEVDALDFIVKPLNAYSFRMKMEKAVKVLKTRMKKEEEVLLPISHEAKILSSRLYYVEVVNHDLYFHTQDGEFHARDTMKHVEELLEGLPFSRCNVCYLVNLDYVVGVEKNEVVLKNGERLSMPRSRRNAFLSDLSRYLGGGYVP